MLYHLQRMPSRWQLAAHNLLAVLLSLAALEQGATAQSLKEMIRKNNISVRTNISGHFLWCSEVL